MKKIVLSLLAVVMTVFASSCAKSGAKSGPEDVALEFTQMLATWNFEGGEAITTEKTKSIIGATTMFLSNVPEETMKKVRASEPKLTVVSTKLGQGDTTATVVVRVENRIDIETGELVAEPDEEKINLVKSGEQWLVDMGK